MNCEYSRLIHSGRSPEIKIFDTCGTPVSPRLIRSVKSSSSRKLYLSPATVSSRACASSGLRITTGCQMSGSNDAEPYFSSTHPMNARCSSSSEFAIPSRPTKPLPAIERMSLSAPPFTRHGPRIPLTLSPIFCVSRLSGNATTIVARFDASALVPRAALIAAAISLARSEIATSLSFGLATVNISAAVSPKPLKNWIGPAPFGRSVILLSFKSISLKMGLVSLTL